MLWNIFHNKNIFHIPINMFRNVHIETLEKSINAGIQMEIERKVGKIIGCHRNIFPLFGGFAHTVL